MSKNQELTPEQKQELDNILEVIQTEADIVKMDYEQNPSNLDSGSIIVVHQNSPLLDDTKEKLSDIAYTIARKSSSISEINEYGDDDWATPTEEGKNE
jgi:predicted transglutaminase-like cysteine proteinase